ncbi:MAG TPA: hypothetical protein VL172_11550, partial [Kofleriaceae bacterium]|nr:hypothetical protein [Kofleriaceae bacterium]
EEIYREDGKLAEVGLAECKDANHYYRVTDATLLVANGARQTRNLAAAIADVMCLYAEPQMPCMTLPDQFADQHK